MILYLNSLPTRRSSDLVMDDERLKQAQNFGKDYFDELLERIRSIRASERRFYQKITDIYKEASIDYDAQAPITRKFYQTRSEEHTSELQSRGHLVCRLL